MLLRLPNNILYQICFSLAVEKGPAELVKLARLDKVAYRRIQQLFWQEWFWQQLFDVHYEQQGYSHINLCPALAVLSWRAIYQTVASYHPSQPVEQDYFGQWWVTIRDTYHKLPELNIKQLLWSQSSSNRGMLIYLRPDKYVCYYGWKDNLESAQQGEMFSEIENSFIWQDRFFLFQKSDGTVYIRREPISLAKAWSAPHNHLLFPIILLPRPFPNRLIFPDVKIRTHYNSIRVWDMPRETLIFSVM